MKHLITYGMLLIPLFANQCEADTHLTYQQIPDAVIGSAFNPHTLIASGSPCIEGVSSWVATPQGKIVFKTNVPIEDWFNMGTFAEGRYVPLSVLADIKAKQRHIAMSADRYSDTFSFIGEYKTKSKVLYSNEDGSYGVTNTCQQYIDDPERHLNLGTEFVNEVNYGFLSIATLKINYFDMATKLANPRLKDTIRTSDFNLNAVDPDYRDKISLTVSAIQLGGEPNALNNIIPENGLTCLLEDYARCLKRYQSLNDYLINEFPKQSQNHEDSAVIGYKTVSFESGMITELMPEQPGIQPSDMTEILREKMSAEYRRSLADNSRATVLLSHFSNLLTPEQQSQIEEIVKITDANMALTQDIYQACFAEPYGDSCTQYHLGHIGKLQSYDSGLLSMSSPNTGEFIDGRYFGRYHLGSFGKDSIDLDGYWLWDFEQQQVIWGGIRKLPTGMNTVSFLPISPTATIDSSSIILPQSITDISLPFEDNHDGTYSISYIDAGEAQGAKIFSNPVSVTKRTVSFQIEQLANGKLAISPVNADFVGSQFSSVLSRTIADSDGDQLPDLIEQEYGMDLKSQDSDQDGFADMQETRFLVMPSDSDLDGIPDSLEVSSDADNNRILSGIKLASGEHIAVLLADEVDASIFVDSIHHPQLSDDAKSPTTKVGFAAISSKNRSTPALIDRLDILVHREKLDQGNIPITIQFNSEIPVGFSLFRVSDVNPSDQKLISWAVSPNHPNGVDVNLMLDQNQVERITLLLAKTVPEQPKPQPMSSTGDGDNEEVDNGSGGAINPWLLLSLMIMFRCRTRKLGNEAD